MKKPFSILTLATIILTSFTINADENATADGGSAAEEAAAKEGYDAALEMWDQLNQPSENAPINKEGDSPESNIERNGEDMRREIHTIEAENRTLMENMIRDQDYYEKLNFDGRQQDMHSRAAEVERIVEEEGNSAINRLNALLESYRSKTEGARGANKAFIERLQTVKADSATKVNAKTSAYKADNAARRAKGGAGSFGGRTMPTGGRNS